MAAEDGLAQLSARQERRRRRPLPTRFPKAEPAETETEPSLPRDAVAQDAVPIRATSAPSRKSSASRSESPARPQSVSATTESADVAPPSPLRAAQHYIDDGTDQALRACRAAGIVRRIDITNSAVVRLAVQRLVDDLGADGVVDLLALEPGDRPRTGRKRR